MYTETHTAVDRHQVRAHLSAPPGAVARACCIGLWAGNRGRAASQRPTESSRHGKVALSGSKQEECGVVLIGKARGRRRTG